jgi:hypothetical protein
MRRGVTSFGLAAALAVGLAGCTGDFNLDFGTGPEAAEIPFAELETSKLETVYQFLRLESGDAKIARTAVDLLAAERKVVIERARAGDPALALAAQVKNGRALGSGRFAVDVAAGVVVWLFPSGCAVVDLSARAGAGASQMVLVGVGHQDVGKVSGLVENRVDLLLIELGSGASSGLVGLPQSGPGQAVMATTPLTLAGECR